jgi:hypothetical protein
VEHELGTPVGHCPGVVECDVIFGVLKQFAAIGPIL